MPDGVRPPAAPARRSRRRHWRDASFASLDFETTGLDYARDAVVSFGVVPVRGGRVVLGRAVHRLVVPAVASSSTAMKVHHILPRDLELAMPADEAASELRSALDGRFLLTWYSDVEIAFLGRIFGGRRRAWTRRTVDVRKLAIALEDADPETRFGLTATAERHGIPVSTPHDALDDALVAAQLFLVLASKLEARGFGSVRSFLRLSRG